MQHKGVIMLHVNMNTLYVNIMILHVDIMILHVHMIYLPCKGKMCHHTIIEFYTAAVAQFARAIRIPAATDLSRKNI